MLREPLQIKIANVRCFLGNDEMKKSVEISEF